MSSTDDEPKVELGDKQNVAVETGTTTVNQPLTDVQIAEIQKQRFRGPLGWFLGKLFDSGAEARGIERVLESDRKQVNISD